MARRQRWKPGTQGELRRLKDELAQRESNHGLEYKEFDEDKHPRDERGRFGVSAGMGPVPPIAVMEPAPTSTRASSTTNVSIRDVGVAWGMGPVPPTTAPPAPAERAVPEHAGATPQEAASALHDAGFPDARPYGADQVRLPEEGKQPGEHYVETSAAAAALMAAGYDTELGRHGEYAHITIKAIFGDEVKRVVAIFAALARLDPADETKDGSMDEVQHKSLTGLAFKMIDEDEGIVETLVSVTGIEDRVKDIIEPGSYAKTLTKRTPKGVWSHDWDTPVAKTLGVVELMPGDPRLPKETKDGERWPFEAGALLVRTQFNRNTTAGEDAFQNVKFFKDEQEWSIGYKVPSGKSYVDKKTGVRHIKEMDLYEYSPVLFGAMPHATTMSVKEDADSGHDYRGDGGPCAVCGEGPKSANHRGMTGEDKALGDAAATAAAVGSVLLDRLGPESADHDLIARSVAQLTVVATGGDLGEAGTTAVFAKSAAARIARDASGELADAGLMAERAFAIIAEAINAEAKAGNEQALLDYWGPKMGQPGSFKECVDALSGKEGIDDPEALCAWIHHETTGHWPGEKKTEEEMKLYPTDAELKAQWSPAFINNLPDSSFAYIEPGGDKDDENKTTPRSLRHFPIKDAQGNYDEAHVRNALGRAPQSPFGDNAMPKIKAAAKALGIGEDTQKLIISAGELEAKITAGDTWSIPGTASTAPTPTVQMVPNSPSSVGTPGQNPTGRSAGTAPTPSIGSVPSGGGTLTSDNQAAVRGGPPSPAPAGSDYVNVAHRYIDDGRGRCARCGRALGTDLHTGWSGDGGVPGKATDVRGVEHKIDVAVTGSWEETQRELRDAASTLLDARDTGEDTAEGESDMMDMMMPDKTCLEATFDDHIVASYYDDGACTYFTIPWMRDSDGKPMLGTPTEVRVNAVLTAKVDPHEIAAILTELKAGRVLSYANKSKLQAAHGHLSEVLASAEVRGDGMSMGKTVFDTDVDLPGDLAADLLELEHLRLT